MTDKVNWNTVVIRNQDIVVYDMHYNDSGWGFYPHGMTFAPFELDSRTFGRNIVIVFSLEEQEILCLYKQSCRTQNRSGTQEPHLGKPGWLQRRLAKVWKVAEPLSAHYAPRAVAAFQQPPSASKKCGFLELQVAACACIWGKRDAGRSGFARRFTGHRSVPRNRPTSKAFSQTPIADNGR